MKTTGDAWPTRRWAATDRRQRGMTVLEMLIATFLMVVMLQVAYVAMDATLFNTADTLTRVNDRVGARQVVERFELLLKNTSTEAPGWNLPDGEAREDLSFREVEDATADGVQYGPLLRLSLVDDDLDGMPEGSKKLILEVEGVADPIDQVHGIDTLVFSRDGFLITASVIFKRDGTAASKTVLLTHR